jgi:hypothetical protein
MTEGEPSESSRLEEGIEVRTGGSYFTADRRELAGEENDPSQTSAYQLPFRPTGRHVVVVAGGKTVVLSGSSRQTVEVQANPVSVAGMGGQVFGSRAMARWGDSFRVATLLARCVPEVGAGGQLCKGAISEGLNPSAKFVS